MRRRLYCLVLVTLLCGSLAIANDQQAKREQLKALKARISALQSELNSKREQRGSEQQALRQVETRLGEIQRDLREIGQAAEQQQAQLRQLQQRRQQLLQEQRRQQQLIEQQILAAYQLGQEKKLKMLLNQEAPDKLSRTLVYYDYFNKARAEQISNYMVTLRELDEITPAIEREAAALETSREQLAARRASLAQQQQKRQQTLAALDREIGGSDNKLRAMQSEQDDLLRLLSAIEQEVASISLPDSYDPFRTRRGKMQWPVNGKQISRFGSSRGGSSLTWNGVEIDAPEGTDVKAIHHGRVVFADWLRGAGLLIILDHGDGYMSLYGHNASLFYETGDWVKAGDAIATVGNSGGRNKASLYFEIRHQGKPTNPNRWCRG